MIQRKYSPDDKIELVKPPHKKGTVTRIAYGHIYLVFFDDGSHDWMREDEIRRIGEQLELDT